MEIQVFRIENSSQTNAYSHYSNCSYSGLIPNERALNLIRILSIFRGLYSLTFYSAIFKNISAASTEAAKYNNV